MTAGASSPLARHLSAELGGPPRGTPHGRRAAWMRSQLRQPPRRWTSMTLPRMDWSSTRRMVLPPSMKHDDLQRRQQRHRTRMMEAILCLLRQRCRSEMFGTFAPAGWPPYPWALPKRPWRRSVRREAFTLPTWRAAVALRAAAALVSPLSSLSSLSSPLGAPREKGVIGGYPPMLGA